MSSLHQKLILVQNSIPFYSSMIFRKTRTHFQGASNRPQTQLSKTHHPLSSTKLYNHRQLSPSSIPFASFVSKPKHVKKHLSFTHTDEPLLKVQTDQQFTTVEGFLQKKYKNNKNIVKLLDHWGVKTNGFLTRQQFREKVSKDIGKDLSPEEVDQILTRHSESSGFMDTQGLISLLLGRSDGIPIDTVNMPIAQNSVWREQLTRNLKEDIKNYRKTEKEELTSDAINTLITKINRGVSRMKKMNQGHIIHQKSEFFQNLKQKNSFSPFEQTMLEQVERGVDFKEMHKLIQFHKNADYLLVDPILRRTKAEGQEKRDPPSGDDLGQTMECKMRSLPNLLRKTLTHKQKRAPFDPVSLLNIDQRKTRFDRSDFTLQSNGWNPDSTCQAVKPDQKQILMQTLQSQASFKQTRYQNKLMIMRANRDRQQQNVNTRQQLASQREKTRLDHIRDQQQAYNYINFIKKRWE